MRTEGGQVVVKKAARNDSHLSPTPFIPSFVTDPFYSLLFLVAKTKEKNLTGRRSIMPMSVWGYYLSAHMGSILFKLALALFAYGGLLALIDLPKFGIAQAFLVGYSLNSFVGVFSAGLDSRASAQLDSFKSRLD
jgi:hypothetical protein